MYIPPRNFIDDIKEMRVAGLADITCHVRVDGSITFDIEINPETITIKMAYFQQFPTKVKITNIVIAI